MAMCCAEEPSLNMVLHKYTISLTEFNTMIELFHPDTFIETGTYRGYTTEVAAKLFKEVKTIELCRPIYEETKQRLEKNYSNIEFFLGNSAFVLPDISKKLQKRGLFYLDAHFCFDGTAKDFNDPPVLGELEGVLKHAPKDAVIIIDDLRVFANNQRTAFDAYNYYPSIVEIAKFVKRISPESSLYILGDEAIIFNPTCHPIKISNLVKYITMSLVNDDIKAIRKGDEGLMTQLNDKDIATLENLHALYLDMDKSLISFWLGLAYYNKDNKKALSYLNQAVNSGFYHPRVNTYIADLKKKAKL